MPCFNQDEEMSQHEHSSKQRTKNRNVTQKVFRFRKTENPITTFNRQACTCAHQIHAL